MDVGLRLIGVLIKLSLLQKYGKLKHFTCSDINSISKILKTRWLIDPLNQN
jgi:hypothetical protein